MSWRDVAHQVMLEVAAAIDAAYPFGTRANWPYKAWLSATRWFFQRYGLPNRRTKTGPVVYPNGAVQLPLFGEDA